MKPALGWWATILTAPGDTNRNVRIGRSVNDEWYRTHPESEPKVLP